MPQALPVIGGILGVVNAVQGIQSQQASQRALSQASGATEAQNQELANLRAILSDPNNPMRAILRAQAESGIAGRVAGGGQTAIAQLARMGLRSPGTAASVLGRLQGAGVTAQGDLERQLINDYMQKRLSLVGGPDVGIRGGLDLSRIAGLNAASSGDAFGSLLNLIQQLNRGGGVTADFGKEGGFGSKRPSRFSKSLFY